jgi:ribosomal protein S18 acetylase RimI-like enzyme
VGPAWHLAYLAVAPEHQGNGYARLLLDHVLDRCDEDGTAAWLETTDPANPARYERFGFQTVRQVHRGRRLPGLWVMRREPHGVGPLVPAG